MNPQPYGLQRTVDATVRAISRVEALKQVELPVDGSNRHFEHIDRLILAAEDLFEKQLSRQLLQATYQMKFAGFPAAVRTLGLPVVPLISVDSIDYLDSAGGSQTLSSSNYNSTSAFEPGFVQLIDGQSWPTTLASHPESVTVTFKAGFGTSSDSVPQSVKLALLFMVDEWFSERGPVGAMTDGIRNALNIHQWGDEFYSPFD